MRSRRSIAFAPDPYVIMDDSLAPGNRDTNAKVLSTDSLDGAAVILIAGQSNVANVVLTPYVPVSTKVYNLNIYDGAVYKATDPLLGCSTNVVAGNFAGRLADKAISAGPLAKVVLANVAIDGTAISQWNALTNYGNRIIVALARLRARGLEPAAILWGQGESDHGTSQVSYQGALTTIIGLTRAVGCVAPWFIAKQTWLAGTVDTNVQAAQLAIVDHVLGIWAGPNADSLNAANRAVDNTHWNDAGSDAYAALWLTALQAYGPPFA